MFRDRLLKPLRSLSILDTVSEGHPTAFICYMARKSKHHWYQKFLHKDYAHCFIIYWDGFMWMKLERLHGYSYVTPLLHVDGYILKNENLKPYFESLGYLCQNVDLSKRQSSMRCPEVICINTCVEYIKDFLGISARLVITPYQLFKYVEKHYGCSKS